MGLNFILGNNGTGATSLRKDDDGVVRLDTTESRELVRRLLGLARSIALALLD